MTSYILEKKRLFLTLLQLTALICQLTVGLRLQTALASENAISAVANDSSAAVARNLQSIIPKSRTGLSSLACQKLLERNKTKAAKIKKAPGPSSKSNSKAPSAAPAASAVTAAAPAAEVAAPAAEAQTPAATPANTGPAAPSFQEVAESFQAAERLRQKYESAYERKAEDLSAFIAAAQEATNSLKNYLTSKNILFKESRLASELAKQIGYDWPTLEIIPEGESRLNKFSTGLKNRFDTTLVIDLFWLLRNEAVGAYLPESNQLLLSREALDSGRAGSAEMHEVFHVRFKTEREEGSPEAITPLQMFFVSDQALSPQKFAHNYEFEMSFEELWTHAYDINLQAKHLAKPPEKQPATAEARAHLRSTIQALYGLAETAVMAGEKAKLAALDDPADFEQIQNVNYAVVKVPDQFIFAAVLKSGYEGELNDYLAEQILQSQRLARFIQDYWAQIETLTDEEIEKKSLEFRGSLSDFMKELESGRTTADAFYEFTA